MERLQRTGKGDTRANRTVAKFRRVSEQDGIRDDASLVQRPVGALVRF